jgi:hypothetical protein
MVRSCARDEPKARDVARSIVERRLERAPEMTRRTVVLFARLKRNTASRMRFARCRVNASTRLCATRARPCRASQRTTRSAAETGRWSVESTPILEIQGTVGFFGKCLRQGSYLSCQHAEQAFVQTWILLSDGSQGVSVETQKS